MSKEDRKNFHREPYLAVVVVAKSEGRRSYVHDCPSEPFPSLSQHIQMVSQVVQQNGAEGSLQHSEQSGEGVVERVLDGVEEY